MPCHHNLEEYLTAYLDGAGLRTDPEGPLFCTIGRGTNKLTRRVLPQANAYVMIRRRAAGAAAMAIAGLPLGGAPVGLLDLGGHLVVTAASDAGRDWVAAALVIGSATTGATVLRAPGRIFLGWGEVQGEEGQAPTEQESEKAERPLWLMLAPAALLLGIALFTGTDQASRFALAAAARFTAWDGGASLSALSAPSAIASEPPPHPFLPWLTFGAALLIAAHNLARDKLPRL